MYVALNSKNDYHDLYFHEIPRYTLGGPPVISDPRARARMHGRGIYIQGGGSVWVDSRSRKRAFTRVTYDVPQVTTLCACTRGITGATKGGALSRWCTCPMVCTVLYDANTLTTPGARILRLHIKY